MHETEKNDIQENQTKRNQNNKTQLKVISLHQLGVNSIISLGIYTYRFIFIRICFLFRIKIQRNKRYCMRML